KITFAGTFGTDGQLGGGTGTDTLSLSGNVGVNTTDFTPKAMGFETVEVLAGNKHIFDLNFGNSTIDFSGVSILGPGTLYIDGAEGSDTLIGSSQGDHIDDHAGSNTLKGMDGDDELSVFNGTGTDT